MKQNERIDVFHFVSKALIVDYCQSLDINESMLTYTGLVLR